MKVSIIFDPAFSGQADEAVWIVNSSANRDWLERQKTLAVGSAIFTVDRYPSLEEAVINMVWNAQEHHSIWKTISVKGIAPTPRITEALAHEGRITGTPAGFALHRAWISDPPAESPGVTCRVVTRLSCVASPSTPLAISRPAHRVPERLRAS